MNDSLKSLIINALTIIFTALLKPVKFFKEKTL